MLLIKEKADRFGGIILFKNIVYGAYDKLVALTTNGDVMARTGMVPITKPENSSEPVCKKTSWEKQNFLSLNLDLNRKVNAFLQAPVTFS